MNLFLSFAITKNASVNNLQFCFFVSMSTRIKKVESVWQVQYIWNIYIANLPPSGVLPFPTATNNVRQCLLPHNLASETDKTLGFIFNLLSDIFRVEIMCNAFMKLNVFSSSLRATWSLKNLYTHMHIYVNTLRERWRESKLESDHIC